MPHDSSLRLTFFGGASAIGASCALVETDSANVLVDCGIRFEAGRELPDLAPLTGKRIDAILLTHAHTDHSGALPVICDAFPGTSVYATPPTIELVGILLRDAIKLMQGADREADLPLYSPLQVDRALEACRPVLFGEPVEVFGTRITWLPASHILGASMIHLSTPAGNLLFTGDYSVTPQKTLPGLARPSLPVDVVVSEATYGERLHEDREAAEQRLVSQISEIVEAGGRVLIPAFAIGRAQEVLCILRQAMNRGTLARLPVWVDGMVRAVCDVYARNERYLSRQLASESRHGRHPFYTDDIRAVREPSERTRILDGGPCVIVASSGMLSGGASAFYARKVATEARDAILLTGYQDEESPGRSLLAMAAGQGPRELRLGGETVKVACTVASYGLSAHADRLQLAGLLHALRPRTVVLVHGDRDAKAALGRSIECRDVVVAEDGQSIVRRGRPRASSGREDELRPLPGPEDVERVRALLGPPGPVPSLDKHVADAWFGEDAGTEHRDRLVARLEALGLVRRDDERRSRLWILAPTETDALPEEARLESALKAENPKGKLLELCMRMRLSPPVVEISVQGAYHVANASLTLGSRVLRSGPQRASTRKTAEQLAASCLLGLVAAESSVDGAHSVGGEAAAELARANPKGRLLEWCAGASDCVARFESRAHAGGHAARAIVRAASGAVLTTAWHVAPQAKTAEQAAAAEALANLGSLSTTTQGPGESSDGRPAAAEGAPAREARMPLNELRQVGIIADFGYRVVDRRGPSHQPVFVVVAWARLPDGSTIEGDASESGSKKTAERDAADHLAGKLAAAGMIARQS